MLNYNYSSVDLQVLFKIRKIRHIGSHLKV